MGRKSDTVILIAEDDEDDYLLAKRALSQATPRSSLARVADGDELMHYLRRTGRFTTDESWAQPGVILLDLNMPKMDGREALKEIKADPALRSIPIIVFTTSKAEEDIQKAYQLGVNSFITKPVTFDNLTAVMKAIEMYWFNIVELPTRKSSKA